MSDKQLPSLSDERQKQWDELQAALAKSIENKQHPSRCFICKQPVFWFEDTVARIEGHIYSEAGRREFGISHTCEYCFDDLFKEMD